MKKILSFLCSAFLLAPVCLLGACGDTPQEPAAEILSEYDFTRDFADRQGYRGWYYYYGDSAGEFTPMTYHEELGMYKGADFWSRVSIHEIMPGLNSETLIAFKAPKTCTLSVSSEIFRNPPDGFKSGQDGIWYYGFVNSYSSADEFLFSERVVDTEFTVHTVTFEASVKEGDMLYFVINPNANENNDNSVLKINVRLK